MVSGKVIKDEHAHLTKVTNKKVIGELNEGRLQTMTNAEAKLGEFMEVMVWHMLMVWATIANYCFRIFNVIYIREKERREQGCR